MKIAFLNLYQGKVNRGAETFVYELSRRLSKNHKVDVIAGCALPKSRWPILWRIFLDPPGLAVAWFTIINLGKIWKEKYDVVISVNGGWQPGLVRLAIWMYGGKVVISGQSGMGWDDFNNLWNLPNIFVALSPQAKAWSNKVCPFIRTDYIPNGVDTKRFSPQGEVLKTRLEKPIVLCVAALTKAKRIDLLIKAVAEAKNISLLIVGDGELKEEIETFGKKVLKERFLLIKLPFSEMPKAYLSADLFSLPSESYQSFEIVLAEAMASGLAVVANNDPIRKEIVGDAGILVNPTDSQAYAKALQEALDKKWEDAPRRQAEKFDWDKIAIKYEQLFKSL